MKALIILPTYNEVDNLGRLVDAIFARGDYHLLIVDDNSTDGTGQIADELKARHRDRIEVIHRAGKLGLGTAYLTGFKHALKGDYELVYEMDADFSHDPGYLPKMREAAETNDVVIGSRYVGGGGTRNWSLPRQIISRGGSLYTRLVLGLPLNDLTAGFVCYRREVLAALDLDRIRSNGYSFQIEMKWRCHQKGFRITEIPIIFPDRQAGESKMSGRIVLEALWVVWKLRLDQWRNPHQKQPIVV